MRYKVKRSENVFASCPSLPPLYNSLFATLAPYASDYVPPTDHPRSKGPIHVTLALGEGEFIDEGMEWEELIPNAQDVLDAVRTLRDGDGLADMQVDLPWELGNGFAGSGSEEGLMVVVGKYLLSCSVSLELTIEIKEGRYEHPHLSSTTSPFFRRLLHLSPSSF